MIKKEKPVRYDKKPGFAGNLANMPENKEIKKVADLVKKETVENKESPKKEEIIISDSASALKKIINTATKEKKKSVPISTEAKLSESLNVLTKLAGENVSIASIVSNILDELYDEDSKTFKYEIEKEDKKKNVNTTYYLKEKHAKALEKDAKKAKVSRNKFFNKMLLNFIENNIEIKKEDKN